MFVWRKFKVFVTRNEDFQRRNKKCRYLPTRNFNPKDRWKLNSMWQAALISSSNSCVTTFKPENVIKMKMYQTSSSSQSQIWRLKCWSQVSQVSITKERSESNLRSPVTEDDVISAKFIKLLTIYTQVMKGEIVQDVWQRWSAPNPEDQEDINGDQGSNKEQ